MRFRVLMLAAVAGLAVPAGSSAATKTTGPGYHLSVLVTINDRGLIVHDQAQVARGSIVTFQVFNAGTKLHSYGVLGKQTGPIKPKHWARFTVTMLTRGRFPDGSLLDKGAGFRGYYSVI